MWRNLCYLQFFLLLVVYVFFGLTPAPDVYAPTFNDKLMHFSGYFISAFSISVAYPYRAFWQRGSFMILFSIAIEIGQHFMPPRTFELLDICANSTGVIVGLSLVYVLQKNITLFRKFIFLGTGSNT